MNWFDAAYAWRCPKCAIAADSRALYLRAFKPTKAAAQGLTSQCATCGSTLGLKVPQWRGIFLICAMLMVGMLALAGGPAIALIVMFGWVGVCVYVDRRIEVLAETP